jgi:ion channel-forming bestrophin family protein
MTARDANSTSLFSFGRTLGRVAIYSMAVAAYSGLAVAIDRSPYAEDFEFPGTAHVVLGLMVSVLLVFRTNSAYAKWWEARTLWGTLINASRNLALKVRHFVPAPEGDRQRLASLLAVFAKTLKDHLRQINDLRRVPGFEDLAGEPHHPPSLVASRIYELIESWRRADLISDQMTRTLDTEARILMEVCGGCERILNTRLAFSYRVFVNKCVFLYVLSLPWGLVRDFHFWTIPMVFVMSFLLIGLEIVAHSVESPFGLDDDNLDLDGMCATLERSVNEILT